MKWPEVDIRMLSARTEICKSAIKRNPWIFPKGTGGYIPSNSIINLELGIYYLKRFEMSLLE